MGERVSYQKQLFDDPANVTKKDILEKLQEWEHEYRERYVRGDEDWAFPEDWLLIRLSVLRHKLRQNIEREELNEVLDSSRRSDSGV